MENIDIMARNISRSYKSGTRIVLLETNYDTDADRILEKLAEEKHISQNKIGEIRGCADAEGNTPCYIRDAFYYSFKNNGTPMKEPRIECLRSKIRDTGRYDEGYVPAVVEAIAQENCLDILVIRNIQNFIKHDNAALTEILCRLCTGECSPLTLLTARDASYLPPELVPYTHVERAIPPRESDIARLVGDKLREYDVTVDDRFNNEICAALRGFRDFEVNTVFREAADAVGAASAFSQDEKKILDYIGNKKRQLLLKDSLLEWVDVKRVSIEGLDKIREYLSGVGMILSDLNRAVTEGVDVPKGILFVGIPGTGKSLFAQYAAYALHLPLIKLDMGSLMGSLVGESEKNLRKAIAYAETLAPCVLWIDEIEKGFSGSKNRSEGAYLSRMLGYFLTWLQRKTASCYIIATANNINSLPPELLRKGRFDECFYSFLPSASECARIFGLYLNTEARRHVGEHNDTREIINDALVKAFVANKFLTGADIENLVSETFKHLYINYRQSGANIDKHEYDIQNFQPVMLGVLENMSVFAKTNITYITEYWLKLGKMNFTPASNEVYPAVNKRSVEGQGYDNKLCQVILSQVENIEKKMSE